MQPSQAAVERRRDSLRDVAELARGHADFGADHDIGRLQHLQDAAEIVFRFPVAVLNRRIEIIDAGRDRARNRAFLVSGITAHHQSTHRAAAEAQHGELHCRAPKDPHLHRRSSG